MLPIRRLLLRELLALFGAVVLVLTGLAWIGMNHVLNQQMQARARENILEMDRDLRLYLEDAEQVGRTAGNWWRAGLVDLDDPGRMEAQALSLIKEFGAVESLIFVTPEGKGLSVIQGPGAISSSLLDYRSGFTYGLPLRRSGVLQQRPDWNRFDYDLFHRPWYETAMRAQAPCWVKAYAFYRTAFPGLSYVVPVRRADGSLKGVICVDMLLETLSRQMQQASPTAHAQTLVSDAGGLALILPRTEPHTDHGPDFLRPLGPDVLPIFHDLIASWEAQGRPSRILPCRRNGRSYLGGVLRLEGLPGVEWNLSIVVPESDYQGIGRRLALALLGLGLLFTGLAAWRIRHLADRFGTPLARLATAAQTLGEGNIPDLPPSDLQEIQTLGDALHRAGLAIEAQTEMQLKLEHSQRLETVGTLAGGIAHDVNNQLAAILGQLNLAQELMSEGHPIMKRLHAAEDATQRCAKMIKSLLSFSHQARPELGLLDLNALVRTTASLLERVLGGIIRLKLDLATALPMVEGESIQLEQVLMNLAVNARDAMPSGGQLTLSTRLASTGEVCLAVDDTGTGIPEDALPRIFDPFFTTKEIGKGTGLGLAMVFNIVKGHGGRIEVESHPGEGAHFRIFLQAKRPSGSTERLERRATPRPVTLAGKRILVVEDEPSLRDLLADAFTKACAQVETAADGIQGWTLWSAGRYDLVVSDQRMPGCTGLELLSRIRATGSLAPMILASGYGLEGLEADLDRDPRLRILPKPFTLRALFELAASLLEVPGQEQA